jgi:hypothetical protein
LPDFAPRLDDWEKRLAAYLDGVRDDVDALGPLPCARFAAEAAHAITGVDYYAPYRGRYKTETGAAKVLRRIGGGDLPSTFDLHFEQKPPAFAQRGDLVFDGEVMGVCVGGTALFVHFDQLIEQPRTQWEKAWAVG